MPEFESYLLGCASKHPSFTFELTVYSHSTRGYATDRIQINPDTRLGDVLGIIMDTPRGTVYPFYGVHLKEPLRHPSDFDVTIQLPPEDNPLVDPNSVLMDPIYYSVMIRATSLEFLVPLEHHVLPRMFAFSAYLVIVYYDDFAS